MRPIKQQKGKKVKEAINKFEVLSEKNKNIDRASLVHVNKFEALSEEGLDWLEVQEASEIDAISDKVEGWERLPMKIDSGAVDTVIPENMAAHIPLTETQRSKAGSGFTAANGSRIKHFGQKVLRGVGDQFQPINMIAQVAGVRTALGSVHRMVQAGNLVHFEQGNCYIQHKTGGQVTPIIEKNGAYEIGLWIQNEGEGLSSDQGFTGQGRAKRMACLSW